MISYRFLGLVLFIAFFVLAGGLLLAEPAPISQPAIVTNPDLQASCGLDVILILDESGSISGTEITAVRNAAQAFVNGLMNTGSRLAIVEFNSVARRPISYTEVTTSNASTIFMPYIHGTASGGHAFRYNPQEPSGVPASTNWDDALEEAKLINFNDGFAPLVVFITDGEPTAYNYDADGETGGFVSSISSQSLWRAIIEANAIKNQGAHILAIGVGLTTTGAVQLAAVSGIDFYTSGTLNITTTDLVVVTNFSALQTELAKVAVQLCQSSLVIKKQVNNGDGQGYVAAPGWQFTTNVAVTGGNPAAYQWVLPEPAPQPGVPMHTGITGPAGSVTFQWKPNFNIHSSFSVTETQQPGYVLTGVSCIVRGENGTESSLSINRSGSTFSTSPGAVAPQDFVTCTVQNGLLNVAVAKTIATSPTGPWQENVTLTPQSPIWWQIVVTNTGAADITNLTITDALLANLAVGCATPPPTTLAAGASYTCIFPATTGGQSVTNSVQVRGCNGHVCKDVQDTAAYTVISGTLTVNKQVNWNGTTPDPAKTFEICIQGPSYPTTPNCKSIGHLGGTLTWTGIIPGEYVVSETDPGEVWEVIIGGSPVQVTAQGSTAAVSNTYRRGSISIEKQVDWNGVPIDTTQTFQVCIQGPSYPTAPDCKTVDFDGEVVTWDNLILGQYTISEVDPGVNWFTTIFQSPVEATIAGNGTTITNVHRRGSLTVTKFVNWNGYEINPGQTFQICIQGPSYPTEPNCQITYAEGGDLFWNELIPGDYTISEVNPGADWSGIINGSPVFVTVDGSSASITNTYSPQVIPECNDSNRDPRGHLQRVLWMNFGTGEAVATVTNTSDVCAYEIALVAYQKYDEALATQIPFSWTPAVEDLAAFWGGVEGISIVLQPGETRTLTVPLPACAAQVDVVFDADHLHPLYADAATGELDIVPLILPALQTNLYGPSGNLYGQRLLATNHTNQLNPDIPYCTPGTE